MTPIGSRSSLLPIGVMLVLLPIGFRWDRSVRVRAIRDVAATVRGRRQDLGLSQAELANRTGVSRKWIYEFEAGKPTAEFGLVLRVLEALGLGLVLSENAVAGHRPSSDRPAGVDLDQLLDDLQARGDERGR